MLPIAIAALVSAAPGNYGCAAAVADVGAGETPKPHAFVLDKAQAGSEGQFAEVKLENGFSVFPAFVTDATGMQLLGLVIRGEESKEPGAGDTAGASVVEWSSPVVATQLLHNKKSAYAVCKYQK